MPVQTTYTTAPLVAIEGGDYDIARATDNISAAATEAIRFGLLVVNLVGDDDDECSLPGAPGAADPIAILATGGASTAGTQTYSGAQLNGTVGDRVLSPARTIEMVFSSHANWDATNAVITGLDTDGDIVTDTIAIPDTGGATVASTQVFSKVTSIDIPAQSGTAGTFTVGYGTTLGALSDVLGIARADTSLSRSVTPGTGYAITQTVSIKRKGRIWVLAENQVNKGDDVFVRLTAAGAEVRGHMRSDSDAGDAIPVKGLTFFTSTTAAGLAVVEVNL